MPKTIYVCEKCGAQFDDWGLCDKHERNDHATISLYRDFEVVHKDGLEFYPSEILVPFTDGAIIKYRINEGMREADPVDRKESPLDSEESEED